MIKPVFYTSHAETVIRERRLEKQWIIDAVRSPEWMTLDPAGYGLERRFHVVVDRGGRYIRVVCVETPQEIRIMSAFIDRDARKPLMKPAVEYDAMANAAYIRFSKEDVLESAQAAESIILDYDEQGRLVGMEVLEARSHLSPATLDEAA